ncbi:hypothetical protein [Saliphagus infecundisoli]|uniref:Uncharacterized protein n=1 Tax=Saliphagus infecundisoli TaxID=1849069 RepID=A0ABD5QIY6_9EURY|nr:hypothetical protein [Saliphagus infecundisoli]
MTGEDDPVQHCELTAPVDILTALEAAAIDSLPVDDRRTVVIFQQAILMVAVTDGQLSTTHAFDVELWNPPPHGREYDPDDLLTGFIQELLAATDVTRTES